MRRYLTALALFLVASPALAQMTFVSQARDIQYYVEASDFNLEEEAQFSGDLTITTFDDFTESIGDQAFITNALASASAWQDSRLSPTQFLIDGGLGSSFESYDFGAEAYGDAGSYFKIEFSVPTPTLWSISGSIEAFDHGQAKLIFSISGGAVIMSESASQQQTPISGSGTLAPGTYQLIVSVNGGGYADSSNSYDYASGAFDVTLDAGSPTAAPAALDSPLLVAPNPMRATTSISWRSPVASGAELLILDARGRRVRRLDAPDTAPVAWDGRAEDGRRLPAGIYFIKPVGLDVTPTKVVLQR